MAKTVTLRLSDSAYAAVKRYAEADQLSMNAFIEGLLDAEDMRRRCAEHDRWMTDHPGGRGVQRGVGRPEPR